MQQMPTGGHVSELCAAMRRLFWKMLSVLTPGHFCIPIGSRKHVMQIIKFTRANESGCQKNITKKFETIIVKHAVPNVN
jgi:hypothetical protein